MIRDARGRSVTQVDPVAMRVLRKFDVIPREPLGEIADEVGLGMSKASRWMLMVSLVCALISLVAIVDYFVQAVSGATGFRLVLSKIGGFFVVLVGPVMILVGARHVRFRRISKVMLRYLRCPHCGYDLRLLPTSPVDGATVCPECGCAWNLDRSWGRAAEPAPDASSDGPGASDTLDPATGRALEDDRN